METKGITLKRLFSFSLLITAFSQCYADASRDPDASICFGTSSGLSVGVDRIDHYWRMYRQYKDCKIVKGNLEITGLASPTLDVSFLQDIEVVTGYVVIALNYVPYLSLEKLKIIRGRELYRGKYALYVAVNYNSENPQRCLRELRLSSLTEIVRGNVNFHANRLCYVNSINWNDILNPASRITGNYAADINNTAPASCKKCHSSCSGGCWGSEPSTCQTLTRTICSSDCGNSRCRGPTRDDCCNDECAAGCTGPTNRDCLVCMHFNNSGVCQTSCPPAYVYDPQTKRKILNPHFKYHYFDRCIEKCPSNLLVEDNGCVESCRAGYHNDGNGKCVQCKGGVCDKECFGMRHEDGPLVGDSSVTSLNIHHFEGCNIIKGNLIFQTYAFVGDEYKKIPPMSLTQLNALRDIKVVTGYIQIVSWPETLTDFSIFGNLQRIGGVDLIRDLVALLIQDNIYEGPFYLNKINSLGFRSLKEIQHGNVYIGYMRNLCYDRLVNWTSIVLNPVAYNTFDHGVLLRRNKDNCTDKVCDAQCIDGCWGPGPRQCQKCRHFSHNGSCVAECSQVHGIALYSVEGVTECQSCHKECKTTCYGPGAGNCRDCQHFRNNGDCVVECPNDKYGDSLTGECLPCNSTCVINRADRLCTGPNAIIGSGGCNFCETVVITRNLEVVRCLPVGSECPDAHFLQENSNVILAQRTCVPCYEGCYNCSGSSKEDCLHSTEYVSPQPAEETTSDVYGEGGVN